ncbi:MAG: fimbrillin family protein [Dysgonamonadaceae bacterium]|nr:fimbrillin family protein [Dysgonamonadaceae bacterium]
MLSLTGQYVGRKLEARLEEESAAPTRVLQDVSLTNGTIIRIIAYNTSSGVTESESFYKSQSDGSLVPVGDAMKLTIGATYQITTYSYNTTSNPPTTGGSTVPLTPYINGSATNDFLLVSAPVTISASDNINLGTFSRRFSRVRYEILAVDDGLTLTEVAVSLTNNYEATLTKSTGELTKGSSSIAQTLAKATATPANDYRIVYPGGEAPALSITGKLNGAATAFPAVSVACLKTLAPGRSYKLVITNLKKILMANILHRIKAYLFDNPLTELNVHDYVVRVSSDEVVLLGGN